MPFVAGAIIAAAVVTAGASIYAADQQKDAAEEQANVQKASEREKKETSIRQLIRERRIKQARIQQASENLGVAGGSGELGAVSSLSTQQASALGQANAFTSFADRSRQISSDLRSDLFKAQVVGTVGQTVGAVAGSGLFEMQQPKTKQINAYHNQFFTGSYGSPIPK
jgi:putative NIF3 family GTP cyclohydrolase 1 type 2